jgi:signal transduction histidine kinase
MLVVLIASPLMLLMVLFGINWPALGGNPSILPKRLLVGFYWLFCAVTALTALPSLGFKAISNYAPHFVLMHGFLTGTLMVVLLHFRVKRVQEEQNLAVRLAQHEAQQQKQQRDTERNFLEMLTHEFRTSLSVIRMAIGSGVMSKKKRSYADNAILSMDQVIERCQQVQKLADGELNPRQDELNLPALLKEWVAQSVEADRIQLDLIDLPSLPSDEKLLKIVIGNLLDNALKYSLKGSMVRLALSKHNGQISLEVSNVAGPAGRPDPNKVFKKYYRNEKAHGYIGSGLGLYIIKNTR